jgi:hypothetical protein
MLAHEFPEQSADLRPEKICLIGAFSEFIVHRLIDIRKSLLKNAHGKIANKDSR